VGLPGFDVAALGAAGGAGGLVAGVPSGVGAQGELRIQSTPGGSFQSISSAAGGFTGDLDVLDFFGRGVEPVGDLDGDGMNDLAVGASGDSDGGSSRGAIWILFLDPDRSVHAQQKISDLAGGFAGQLDDGDSLFAPAALGDLDGDGVGDLAVGAPLDDDGGLNRGAVWILFLRADGSVRAHQKISELEGSLLGSLSDGDQFGLAVSGLGDIDGDGIGDLAVGAPFDDGAGVDRGAVWILFLMPNGNVRGEQKLSDLAGGFGGALRDLDHFGAGLASLGDLDGDGAADLAAGASRANGETGAVWLLFLDAATGKVRGESPIGRDQSPLLAALAAGNRFGTGLAALGPLDGYGTLHPLAVGAPGNTSGATGMVWILELNGAASGCGNAVVDAGEQCDDGDAVALDGCSVSCRVEERFALFAPLGVGFGGTLSVTISGIEIVLDTTGHSPAALMLALAGAIDADPALSAAGVSATALGNELVVTGRIAGIALSDPGLRTRPNSFAYFGFDQGGVPIGRCVSGANTAARWPAGSGRCHDAPAVPCIADPPNQLATLGMHDSATCASIVDVTADNLPPGVCDMSTHQPAFACTPATEVEVCGAGGSCSLGGWSIIDGQLFAGLGCQPFVGADFDCDGASNGSDACPWYPSTFTDALVPDGATDGRAPDCRCGDQTGDGVVNVGDIVGINYAIFASEQTSPLCDVNNDNGCNVSDIVGTNTEIFNPGRSICGRHPVRNPSSGP
jgi:cysteine-rich repeat protein